MDDTLERIASVFRHRHFQRQLWVALPHECLVIKPHVGQSCPLRGVEVLHPALSDLVRPPLLLPQKNASEEDGDLVA